MPLRRHLIPLIVYSEVFRAVSGVTFSQIKKVKGLHLENSMLRLEGDNGKEDEDASVTVRPPVWLTLGIAWKNANSLFHRIQWLPYESCVDFERHMCLPAPVEGKISEDGLWGDSH